VIRSFGDEDVENFFRFGKTTHRKGWTNVAKIVSRKLDMLDYSRELIDLRSPPNNRLEKLNNDLEGYYSIRINDQWRIIFKWDHQPYDVKVVDYH
jgi:proteic killer suppression protein